MKFHVIVNPAGAGGSVKAFWQQTEPLFHGADYEVHYSDRERGIVHLAAELTAGQETVNLIIVGGDGSMNEAINGIRDISSVRLGLLPCGSANDLAKDIGIAPTIEEQVSRILSGEVRRQIDVGEAVLHTCFACGTSQQLNEKDISLRFNVSAGIGWDAEICYCADHSRLKKPLNKIRMGKLIYIAEAARTVFAMHPFSCRVEYEAGQRDFTSCVFCAVMNHRFEGGGFMFGPDAKNNDGILDLCAVDHITPLPFFILFRKAYSGKQFETEYAHEERSPQFRFHTDRPVYLHTDGEVRYMTDDATIRLMKEKLNLLF